jgi:hypothetical protein
MVIQVPAPAAPQTASVPPAADNAGSGSGSDQGGRLGPAAGGTGDLGAPSSSPPPVFDTPAPAPPSGVFVPPPVVSPPPVTTPADEAAPEPTEPAAEPTAPLEGTVVHLNPEAVGYTIATDDGELIAIHSREAPRVGRVVEVKARSLANGTYAEEGNRKQREARGRVAFDGTVSFSDPKTGAYTVSAPGTSLLVRGGAQRTPPAVGERVEVEARIADRPEPLAVTPPGEDGCGKPPQVPKPPAVALEQIGLRVAEGEPAASTDVEGIVEGVCREARKLIVSADDVRESGRDVAIAIPEAIRVAALEPGQVLKLEVEITRRGTLKLSTVAGDEGAKGADDTDLVQP